jgi:hypothetical protein
MCNILKNVIILNYLSYIFNTHVIYSLLLFLFYNQRRSHDIDPYYLLIFNSFAIKNILSGLIRSH